MPNILTERQQHERYCTQPDMGGSKALWGRTGDVRRCKHGLIMEGYEVRGVIPAYWQTLSPIWTPIRYRRARRALEDS